jgi:hypothetical protein
MAIGGIVATVAAALEIISRARTRLHSGNSGEPAPPIR